MASATLKEQLRRNTVALISLVVAVTSLGYNTWRNEASEHNRNQRLVAIELLILLGDMHQALLDRTYGKSADAGAHQRRGWALALTINDLSMVAAGEVPAAAANLLRVWSARFEDLRDPERAEGAKEAIETALERVRFATHDVLRGLT